MSVPDLDAFAGYLRRSGWRCLDQDDRSSLWEYGSPDSASEDIKVVLPTRQEVVDYADRIRAALEAVSHVEQRLPQEIVGDMSYGGADTLAVRLTPDTPPGEAPLELAHAAIDALRTLIIASAAALEVDSLVLPLHRPARAEAYARQARVSTQSGSFVLSLSLPLFDTYGDGAAQPYDDEDVLIPRSELPDAEPFGRRVTNRVVAAATAAQTLADHVNSGAEPINTFGKASPTAPNATELAALSTLGGPDHNLYQIRVARSPLLPGTRDSTRLEITPGQQRLFAEAAEFLRTRQPRSGVVVIGLVVRLSRNSNTGPGKAVIQGVDDDTGATRRFQVELRETAYNEAVRAHKEGLQVTAEGDLVARGNHLSLRNLAYFNVIPGIDD